MSSMLMWKALNTKMSRRHTTLFASHLIDLSVRADIESKTFTARLFWQNIALKVNLKLKAIVDQGFGNAVKQRIEHKLRSNKAVSPHDILLYRMNYWEKVGENNFRKLVKSIMRKSNNSNHIDHISSTTNRFSHQFLQELFGLCKKGGLTLVYGDRDYDLYQSTTKDYVFFDNYLFKNGGHSGVLESTIDNLLPSQNNIKLVFILDKRMVLLPHLSKLILDKYENKIIFDASELPIKLPVGESHDLGRIKWENILDLSQSIPNSNSIFNPIVAWRNDSCGAKKRPTGAWVNAYSKSDSLKISGLNTKDQYVVIHARTSTFMSDNIRNTPEPCKRGDLFKGLKEMGLKIIVLGVLSSDSKYKDPDANIIYGDDLGPIPDDLQIHIINGAIGMIGAPSGITHIPYCTNTPVLFIDHPFPFFDCHPYGKTKVLMKKLKKENQFIGLAKYFTYSQKAHLEADQCLKAFSPLNEEEIILECNSDKAVLHAFKELLLSTYSKQELQGLNIPKDNIKIDFEASTRDKKEIASMLMYAKDKPHNLPFIENYLLSDANWLY